MRLCSSHKPHCLGKLHPKLSVIVNKVQLKSSGSVICLEFKILVELGISN